MTLRFTIAAVLAAVGLVLLVLSVRQYRAGRATGTELMTAVGGGIITLVAAGALALGA